MDMLEQLLGILSGYGLPGICVFIACLFIYRMQNIHREEREEWRQQAGKQHSEVLEVTKDSHTILSEIRTLIQFKN